MTAISSADVPFRRRATKIRSIRPVSPGYFSTVGIPLRFGRDFAATDDSTTLPVAIVDETLASRYWKGAEALGKRIRTTGDTTWFTIVGVVGGVRDGDATRPLEPHLYNSLPQTGGNPLSLAIRTAGNPAAVVTRVRAASRRSNRRFRSTACKASRRSSISRLRRGG